MADYMLVFMLQKLLSLLALLNLELQRHILVWHVYYIVLSQFQWFHVYAVIFWDNAVFTEFFLNEDRESSGFDVA